MKPNRNTALRSNHLRNVLAALAAVAMAADAWPSARAATPPTTVNYQGVLRDQNDAPLDGSYDIVLRFMSLATLGDEILLDAHTAANANAVTVSTGLFTVALGSGTVSDGSGPGTYTALDAVFADYGEVWLEVQVGAETLAPRTRIQSAPFALNTTRLAGRPAAGFVDTSATEQTKSGVLNVVGGSGPQPALSGENLTLGGIGISGNGEQIGVAGSGRRAGQFVGSEYGLVAYGSTYAAGWFLGQGLANGVFAKGSSSSSAAGHFESVAPYSPYADLANGNVGVGGYCLTSGGVGVHAEGETNGIFALSTGNLSGGSVAGSFTALGAVSTGVIGQGVTGALFKSTATPALSVKLADSGSGMDVAGAGNVGIHAAATGAAFRGDGGSYGGYFTAGGAGGYGGYFTANGANSYGLSATGVHTGISASGQTRGGYFTDTSGDTVTLATPNLGISASSSGGVGGYFSNGSPFFAYTQIPYADMGIFTYGSNVGGQFNAFSTSNYAQLATSTYKIRGTGTVSFVQNHPTDSSKVIVYVAPEGDEAAVYTRGSGKLVNGEARVALGETFAMVANPDIGLTATATPRGEPIALAVAEVGTDELVVRGPAGSTAEFDYMVWGLRIGFEEQSIVQPKRDESRIPSMHDHERFFADEPGLRNYTALARFTGVEKGVKGRKSVSLSRADALRQEIGVAAWRDPAEMEHDPARLAAMASTALPAPDAGASAAGGVATGAPSEPPAAPPSGRKAAGAMDGTAGAPRAFDDDTLAAARASDAGLDLFTAEGSLEAGDVLSLVPDAPGAVTRSSGPVDALVLGCALAAPSSGRVAVATSHVALCRADATSTAILVGDRLSPSSVPGLAAKWNARVAGEVVLGRAIDPLPAGVGLIRVLIEVR